MENKINIVEYLKNSPQGMKLDCTMFENVTFEGIKQDEYPIIVKLKKPNVALSLTETGGWNLYDSAKCVIFPKGKTTWEGFVPPCKFKVGDVVFYNDTIAIFKEWGDETLFRAYVIKYLYKDSAIIRDAPLFGKSIRKEIRLATEEEKQKLFQAIKDNGYRWNTATKTLEELVEPRFHEGNWIVFNGLTIYVKEVVKGFYRTISKDGISNSYNWDIDNIARLWTINDAKDGDVLATSKGVFIYNGNKGGGSCPGSYCGINTLGRFQTGVEHHWTGKEVYPATKEQCNLFFQKIKDNGYNWNAKTKTLEKLPKFKVGNRIKKKGIDDIYAVEITAVTQTIYIFKNGGFQYVDSTDKNYELVPNK